MTREELLNLANDAGFYIREEEGFQWLDETGDMEPLECFANLVAAEYKRDALRYRWLKENIRGGSIGTAIGWFDDDVSDWDKDIDAAIADQSPRTLPP